MQEKSMYKRYKDKEISSNEYQDWSSQKNGYKNIVDYREQYYAKNRDTLIKKQIEKYWNNRENIRTRNSILRHSSGQNKSLSENKECGAYLGIYIAERILSHMFDNVQRMSYGNPGYDFICNKGYKIEVKSACLCKIISRYKHEYFSWRFTIKKNRTADYFLLLAFDNRNDLNPMHIWLIKRGEIIETIFTKVCINDKQLLSIQNIIRSINKYSKYELPSKLEKIKNCCISLKK